MRAELTGSCLEINHILKQRLPPLHFLFPSVGRNVVVVLAVFPERVKQQVRKDLGP